MTDAPERIWAKGFGIDYDETRCSVSEWNGDAEYIRADLHAGALDRIAELEAALSGGVLSKVDSRNILEALAAAEARADKLAAELAEARSWLTSCVAMIQHAIGEGYDVFIEPDTKRTLSQASTLAKGDQP